MIDTRNGDARLLDLVPDQSLPAEALLELTGDKDKARRRFFPSGLERRVATAWVTPLCQLSCAQCRMLVGQQLGLNWLAAPVAIFVARYPMAECDLYPGDLSVVSLLAWRDFLKFAPVAAMAMIRTDFTLLLKEADEDPSGSILKHAVAALAEALANVR